MVRHGAGMHGDLRELAALEVFCRLHSGGATGRLDLTDEGRRWAFHLDGGEVIYTRSNLKSETLERLRERLPAAEPAQLQDLQGTLRLVHAASLERGTWSFVQDEPPPSLRPARLLPALWEVVVRSVPLDRIERELLGEVSYPRLAAVLPLELAELPGPPQAGDFIALLDGVRPLAEVVAFSQLETADALRVLYLARALGLVELVTSPRGTQVRPTAWDLDAQARTALTGVTEEAGRGRRPAPPTLAPPPRPETPRVETVTADARTVVVSRPEPQADPTLLALGEELASMRGAANHFQRLGLPTDTEEGKLRTRYFELARRYHPDAWHGRPPDQVERAHTIFQLLSEAWSELGDATRRAAYVDRAILGKKTEDEEATERAQEILTAEGEFKVGLQHLADGRVVQAHEVFERVLAAVPDDPEFKLHRHYTAFRLAFGRDPESAEEAERLFKVTLNEHRTRDQGWVLYARILLLRENEEAARTALLRALKLKPANTDAAALLRSLQRRKESTEKRGILGLFRRG